MAAQSAVSYPTAPGPDGGFLGIRAFRQAQSDLIGYFAEAKTYGDVARCRLGMKPTYFISDPALIYTILVDQVEKFPRTQANKHILGKMLGKGILLTDGPFWLRQRRLVQPAFHHKRIETYAKIMVDLSERLMAGWEEGQQREISADMQRLTLNIIAKTLFDAEDDSFADRVHKVAAMLQEGVARRFRLGIDLDWLPTKDNREYHAGLATLDELMREIIDERRKSTEDRGDLMSMLLAATDEQGQQMSDQQIRDEALTLFLAGHDTTSLLLSWTFYLLTQHPDVERKLHDELDTLLEGRAPTLADLPKLRYTEMIIKETLRLYPSAYLVSREPNEDVTLGGYRMRKGSQLFISPYLLHRDERFFENATEFRPERFVEGFEKSLPRCAYIPFLAGPHICIGNVFAHMEARLLLATICQRWRFERATQQAIYPVPFITLYLSEPLQMRLHKR